MNNKFYLMILSLLILPGCERVINWGKETFYQGKELDKYLSIPRKHIRSIRVYDQFTTKGIFNVMFLSNAVKKAYSDVYVIKHTYSPEKAEKFLRDQLKENTHFITFYLLVDKSSLGDKLLSDKKSPWSISLRLNDIFYDPIEISLVELSPEYKMFFGKLKNQLKDSYLVKFDANDINGNKILTKDIKRIEMVLRSVDRQVSLYWCFDHMGNITKCKFNPILSKYEKEKVVV